MSDVTYTSTEWLRVKAKVQKQSPVCRKTTKI